MHFPPKSISFVIQNENFITVEGHMTTYKDRIDNICRKIHTDIVDFSIPRNEPRQPSAASSEFITHKQQGDWAEDVILRAINEHSTEIVAVKYGKTDNLIAGEEGFEKLFEEYQKELDEIGKRPDILLFKKTDFDQSLGYDISNKSANEIDGYVRRAIAGIEVRSSSFLIDKYIKESNRIWDENSKRIFELRDDIINNYSDLLTPKNRKSYIEILKNINIDNLCSVDFRKPSWKSSARLSELSSKFSEIKDCLKIIQKRNSLSITPKVEDLKVVRKWIMTYNVPHYYVQVFFDRVYGVSFMHILELIANPDLEDEKYFIEQDTKNQNKTTIKIPAQDGICLANAMIEPNHFSERKELNKGRLLFYVKFEGGEAFLNANNFKTLFNVSI